MLSCSHPGITYSEIPPCCEVLPLGTAILVFTSMIHSLLQYHQQHRVRHGERLRDMAPSYNLSQLVKLINVVNIQE